MKNVLILLAHPNIEESKANAGMLKAIEGMENVKVMNLYKNEMKPETYHDAFKAADVVIFQFPIWWASAPYMMKRFIDECYMQYTEENGFMDGKKLAIACTTGSPAEAYRAGGANKFTIDELLRPYELTANYGGMIYTTPFTLYGAMMPDADKRIEEGGKQYREFIANLQK